MTDESRVRQQLAVLDEALLPEPDFEASPARRGATLAALTELVPRPGRRRRRLSGLGLALAASIALAFGVRSLSLRPSRPAAEVSTVAGQHERSDSGVEILFTRGGRAGLAELAGNGSTRLRLLAGAVEIQVPKQRPGESFEVVTPDAKVVVHGTRFSVDVTAVPGGSRSCVSVQEGLVSVVRGAARELLGPGASSGCSTPAQPSAAQPTPAPAPSLVSSPAPQPSAGERANSASSVANLGPARDRRPPTPSALADANRLLSRGLELEREGQREAAEQAFSELLQRFPSSAIAPEARSALERVRRGK